MPTNTNHKFPCPVCTNPLEVRLTKKNKPYVTCDPCGVQMFVRGPAGIGEFERLVEQGNRDGLSDRLEEMERRYRLKCPECACRFWIEPDLIETSTWDGSLKGIRCPGKGCGAIVEWGKKK
jgi:DNA-directed RNA polymerase subunit RPC12/RpoP